METLKKTPLHSLHSSLGGRMVPFSGWEMPIQYSSILDEARAVRSNAGIFDVSHMGRVTIEGDGSASFLNRILSFNVPALRIGRAKYNLICNEEGGIIDDCIVYRREDERFLLIPNAGNSTQVLDWLEHWQPSEDQVRIQNVTTAYAMIACQGPNAVQLVSDLAADDVTMVRPFAAMETEIAGVNTFLGRTGYTGEDGFELILPSESAKDIWNLLVHSGAVPCGLGARDVLRLEAGLLLHGNDMDTSVNPYEAGLERFVEPERENYLARETLLRIKNEGVTRKLVGFTMVGRGVARHGMNILHESVVVGEVTSGGHSPTLDMNIGLGYVPTGISEPGSRFHVDVRGRHVEAETAEVPFYSRRRVA